PGTWSGVGGGVVVFIRLPPPRGAAVGGGATGPGAAALPSGTAPGVRGYGAGAGGSRCPSPAPGAGDGPGVWPPVGVGRPRHAVDRWHAVGPDHTHTRSGRGGPGRCPRHAVRCWVGRVSRVVPGLPDVVPVPVPVPASWGARAARAPVPRGSRGRRGAHAGSGGAGPRGGLGVGRRRLPRPGTEPRQGRTVQRYTGSCWQIPLLEGD